MFIEFQPQPSTSISWPESKKKRKGKSQDVVRCFSSDEEFHKKHFKSDTVDENKDEEEGEKTKNDRN